jgi:hypothetical protein
VTENIKERLLISMHKKQKFDKRRFYLKELNDMQVREKYVVTISIGFATLENLDESEDINRRGNNTGHSTQSQLKRV